MAIIALFALGNVPVREPIECILCLYVYILCPDVYYLRALMP